MRTFKRPMFRKGGNAGSGIMSGVVERTHAANGYSSDEFQRPTYGNQLLGIQANKDIAFPKADVGQEANLGRSISEVREAMGDYGGMDPLTSYLLAAGPKIASSTSFSDMISNLEDPNKMLIRQAADKAAYERGLKMEGYKAFKGDEEKYGEREYEYGQKKAAHELSEAIGKRTTASDKLALTSSRKWEEKMIDKKSALDRETINLQAKIDSENLNKQQKWETEMQIEDNKQKAHRIQMQLDDKDSWQDDEIKKETITIMGNEGLPRYQAERQADWKWKKAGELSDRGYTTGSIFTQKQIKEPKETAKFAKTEGRKGNAGAVYYDYINDVVFQLTGNKGEGFRFVELDEDMSVTQGGNNQEKLTVSASDVDLTYDQAQNEAFQRNLQLIEEPPEGASRGWLMAQKRKNPGAITKAELEEIIRKEKFKEKYKNIKGKQ